MLSHTTNVTMNRIAHTHLGGDNALFREKRDRYRKNTRFIRYSTVIAGLILGIFSLVVWLNTSVKKKISEPVRWVCLGLSLTFLVVPGLASLWIWARFRNKIHPSYTDYGGLKDYQYESPDSHTNGWEGFWVGSTLDKVQLIWLNFACWAVSLRGRWRDHDASIGMETSRGAASRSDDLEAASGAYRQEAFQSSSGSRPGNSHEMAGLPEANPRRASETPTSVHSQAVQTPAFASRYGAPLEFWKYGHLLSDPWRLGLSDTRVYPLPDTDTSPYKFENPTKVLETGIDIGFRPLDHTWWGNEAPSSRDRESLPLSSEDKDELHLPRALDDMSRPSDRRLGRSHSVPETSTMHEQHESFASQGQTQHASPSPPQQRPRVHSPFNSAGRTRIRSSRHDSLHGIMRRIRILRPGVELYRRMPAIRGPSARLEPLATGNQGALQPDVAEFVLNARRKKFFDGM